MPYYGVAKGRTPGIYMKWDDCKSQVNGYSNAEFKKFGSVESARDFVEHGSGAASSGSQQPSGSSGQGQQPSSGSSGGQRR